MPTDRLIILGSGGHAKVVLEIALLSDRFRSIEVHDSDIHRDGRTVSGFRVTAPVTVGQPPFFYHVAIGDWAARRAVLEQMAKMGGSPVTLTHPCASLSANATLGDGSVLAANAIVASEAKLGRGCIINHGAVVDHDCVVGDFSHIAPNAVLGGGTIVGQNTLISAGAVVLPGLRVGNNVLVAAGAVVRRNVPNRELWAGVPAIFKKALVDDQSG